MKKILRAEWPYSVFQMNVSWIQSHCVELLPADRPVFGNQRASSSCACLCIDPRDTAIHRHHATSI
ncbi:hypothetical protein J6590_032570 [Homalodisca vitripennis]|nr:hypothetical protein J6590_032570 [Homalodisca vitripennis]